MKRYSLKCYSDGEQVEIEDRAGEWVRYEDVKHLRGDLFLLSAQDRPSATLDHSEVIFTFRSEEAARDFYNRFNQTEE